MDNILNNNEAWECYYEKTDKQISEERINSIRLIHSNFLEVLLSQNKIFVTEIGIGTGAMGYTLSCLAKQRGLDLNVFELDYSMKFLRNAQAFNGNSGIQYIHSDTFALPMAENFCKQHMIFHQGLMEHFTDHEIRLMLAEQLRVADTVIATVPSHKYIFEDGLRGDERLMPLEEWTQIIAPIANINGFYYGLNPGEHYHICLIISKKE
ncbi:class I SAM-dependent methyltransferase [Candidatus Dojkabacteria bacterium]|uniref:Class I SAM-dependent methyltransferase n=1 Tax=Candidatus Dojkabacteria bacterium TaxID=2099670 RepID=A0A955RMF8_9BACT|nr:class I SAM-dependent methyltransferase [Candidatus Dojkabacteria bacterium]